MPKKLPVEKLDRSRAYAETYGPNDFAIAYSQAAMGVLAWPYDNQGHLIEAALTDEQRAKLEQRRALIQAEPEEGPVVTAQEEARAIAEMEDAADRPPIPSEDDGINFEMWLRGEIKYKPHELQAEAKKRFGVNKPRPSDLAVYLVEEQKLVPHSQVVKGLLPPQAANS
jgi:YD repeat-containing protein